MTKKTAVLLASLFLVFVYSSPSLACQANCGGASCTGTGDCHCDPVSSGGSTILVPHCTDKAFTPTDEYVNYLRTWNLSGLNRMADAAEEMMKAAEDNDLTAYQQALDKHNKAEAALSKTERQIYRGFERPALEPADREK